MYKSIENPMSEIFKYLAISILFMFIGFIFGQMFVPISFAYYANKIFILLVIGLLIMSIFSRKNIIPRSFSMNFVYMFTFIDGIIIYPLLQYYLQDLGKDVFISILVATIVLFTVLAKLASRKDAGYYLLKLHFVNKWNSNCVIYTFLYSSLGLKIKKLLKRVAFNLSFTIYTSDTFLLKLIYLFLIYKFILY